LVQANAVQNVNGVIELVASGNLNLGTVPNAANPNPTPTSKLMAMRLPPTRAPAAS